MVSWESFYQGHRIHLSFVSSFDLFGLTTGLWHCRFRTAICNMYVLGHYLLQLCQLGQWEEQRYGLSYKLWSIIFYPAARAFFCCCFGENIFTACVQPRGNISFLAWPKKITGHSKTCNCPKRTCLAMGFV